LKRWVQRVLARTGYAVYREQPRDLANPLPVEQAAHRALLRALLDRLAIDCVLDVGAHTGGFGIALRELGYAGEIVSFEPVAASFAGLASRADARWQVHRLALGRTAGTATLKVARAANFTSFLEPNAFSVEHFGGSRVAHTEDVPVRRLDEVFHPGGRRVLLKTDTQGWDLEVIAGAAGILDAVLAVQVELSLQPLYEGAPGWLDALATLRELGFRPAQFTSVGRDGSLGLLELDCLLVRDGAREGEAV
jgi:FkbM family methyltransferase